MIYWGKERVDKWMVTELKKQNWKNQSLLWVTGNKFCSEKPYSLFSEGAPHTNDDGSRTNLLIENKSNPKEYITKKKIQLYALSHVD